MEPAGLTVGAAGMVNVYNSSADVLELVNDTESLRRTLKAARLQLNNDASNPYPLRSLVRQATDALTEAAILLEDLPSDGTSIAVRMLYTLRKKRWNEKREAIISKMRIVNSSLIHIMEVLEQGRGRREQRRGQEGKASDEEIIIAILGGTGSGKSSFIQRVTCLETVKDGHGLESEIPMMKAFSISVHGRVITFVDTQGFDDTSISDVAVLRRLSIWLEESYGARRLLSGIIYMHDINQVRLGGSSRRNLRMFAKLVGTDALHNIVFVTSKWDLLSDPAVGVMREEELRDKWWHYLIEHGSTTARSSGDRESALAIVKDIAFGRSADKSANIPIAFQKEMVDEHRPLEETSAGKLLSQRMDELEQSYRISELIAHYDRESASTREEKRAMRREIHRPYREQLALRDAQSEFEDRPSGSTQDSVEVHIQYTKPEIDMEIGSNELLGADLPSPYSPRAPSRMTVSLAVITDTIASSPSLINGLYQSLRSVVSKSLRPQLQKGHSRIEWICSCGDLLFGDYIERKPGSLQSLAAQLGGRIIRGPAFSQVSMNSTSIPPRPPAQAHLKGTAAGVSSNGSSAGPIDTQTSKKTDQNSVSAGKQTSTAIKTSGTSKKWLELCIRSSTDVSILAEIDIAGDKTDHDVFDAIRVAYLKNKHSARLFNRFNYRVSTGGGSVMFRKDKLATTGIPPTVSIMQRKCMPNIQEAKQYHYNFDPMPMDEPPIDSRTFHHYLEKPHLAHPAKVWIARLPQLNSEALFWDKELLAKGWGMEITEDRNWLLFAVGNFVSLLLSGTVAAIYIRFSGDNAIGVAIGAWLTAVQAIMVTVMLSHWTS